MKHTLIFLLCALWAVESFAGVRSLGESGTAGSAKSHKNNTASGNITSAPIVNMRGGNTTVICQNAGFTLQKCPVGYAPVFACPQNNKYFRDCCPQDYRYSQSSCYERGLEPSVETCLGFHACRPKTETTEPQTDTSQKKSEERSPGTQGSLRSQHNKKAPL